ncbi:MAG: VOC family protein [Pseudomonadota bacterium]
MPTPSQHTHVKVTVDDIDAALAYYQDLLGAKPMQLSRRPTGTGFVHRSSMARTAQDDKVSTAFLGLPGLTLELTDRHAPRGNLLSLVQHIARKRSFTPVTLPVSDIDGSFEHLTAMPDTQVLGTAPAYRPVEQDLADAVDGNLALKQDPTASASGISVLQFVDRYGIRWECQAASDSGDAQDRDAA